jgi:hypothetical protein
MADQAQCCALLLIVRTDTEPAKTHRKGSQTLRVRLKQQRRCYITLRVELLLQRQVLQLLVVLKQQVQGKLIKEQSGLIPASCEGLEIALQRSMKTTVRRWGDCGMWHLLGHPSTHRLTPQVNLASERLSGQGTSLCGKKQTSGPKHNLQR